VTPDTVTVNGLVSAEIIIKNVSTGKNIGLRTCSGMGTVVNVYPPIKVGETVVAVQVFTKCSKVSSPSKETDLECPPITYDPDLWNNSKHILYCNNCYNYTCDIRTDNFAQPGKGGTPPKAISSLNL
jgi:hypothetical protein